MKKIFITISLLLFGWNVDLMSQCVPDDAPDNDVTKAVAMVEYDGHHFTGALVNNINEDGRLLFLTSGYPFAYYCNPNGISSLNSTNIEFTWVDGSVTYGATYLAGNDDVALLELSTAPFETYSLLGLALAGAGYRCYTNYDGSILKEVKSNSSQFGTVSTNCATPNIYDFTVGSGAYNVTSWMDQVSMKKGEYSRGAPLLENDGLIVGLYIAHKPGGNCNNDSAYFILEPGQEFPNELGNGNSNLRAITYTKCIDVIIKPNIINASEIIEANIRIVGSSSINNVEVVFRAGEEVLLEDGFDSGTNFIAEIVPCFAKVEEITTKREEPIASQGFNSTNKKNNSIDAFPSVLIDNQVTIETKGLEYIDYVILDLSGKIIKKESNKRNKSFIVSLPNTSKGIYFLKISSADYYKTIKLIKK